MQNTSPLSECDTEAVVQWEHLLRTIGAYQKQLTESMGNRLNSEKAVNTLKWSSKANSGHSKIYRGGKLFQNGGLPEMLILRNWSWNSIRMDLYSTETLY